MWKEKFVAQFKVLYRHLPVGLKKKHEKFQSGQPVSAYSFFLRLFDSRQSISHNLDQNNPKKQYGISFSLPRVWEGTNLSDESGLLVAFWHKYNISTYAKTVLETKSFQNVRCRNLSVNEHSPVAVPEDTLLFFTRSG
jgi:hypothetical protein